MARTTLSEREGGRRLPIVGVMGSGTEAHEERALPLGRWLGTLPVHLLTGGGGGVMSSVSRAFSEVRPREGLVIGVLPGPAPREGYPNPWVEIAIRTHLPYSGELGCGPQSRNSINVLSADVIVALPGSHGTASEVRLALDHGRPLVAFLDGPEQITGLPADVRVEPDLAAVQRFVLEHLGTASQTGVSVPD